MDLTGTWEVTGTRKIGKKTYYVVEPVKDKKDEKQDKTQEKPAKK
jgi:hypothetical protein